MQLLRDRDIRSIFYLISPEWCILIGGMLAGGAFLIGEKMSIEIILAIFVTSIATYSSRFFGALTSEKIDENSKIIDGLIV